MFQTTVLTPTTGKKGWSHRKDLIFSFFLGYLPEDLWPSRPNMKRRGWNMLFLMEKPAEGLFSDGKVKKEIFDRCELLLIPLDI
jgi:hypothetical protein